MGMTNEKLERRKLKERVTEERLSSKREREKRTRRLESTLPLWLGSRFTIIVISFFFYSFFVFLRFLNRRKRRRIVVSSFTRFFFFYVFLNSWKACLHRESPPRSSSVPCNFSYFNFCRFYLADHRRNFASLVEIEESSTLPKSSLLSGFV